MEENSQAPQSQAVAILSSISTRIRDLEERNKMLKERVLLLGKNMISIKEGIEKENDELKEKMKEMQKQFNKISSTNKSISSEVNSFVKRDEIRLIERMLKDFEPLEFARTKDLDELEKSLMGKKQNLNKKQTTKKTREKEEI